MRRIFFFSDMKEKNIYYTKKRKKNYTVVNFFYLNKENVRFTGYVRVGPTYWGHPHVRDCCAVVVLVLYKNQIPLNNNKNMLT